jgi:hypothetical protein
MAGASIRTVTPGAVITTAFVAACLVCVVSEMYHSCGGGDVLVRNLCEKLQADQARRPYGIPVGGSNATVS